MKFPSSFIKVKQDEYVAVLEFVKNLFPAPSEEPLPQQGTNTTEDTRKNLVVIEGFLTYSNWVFIKEGEKSEEMTEASSVTADVNKLNLFVGISRQAEKVCSIPRLLSC